MGNSNAPAHASATPSLEHQKAVAASQQRMRHAERKRIVAHLDPHRAIDPDCYVPQDDVAMVFARNPLCDAVALCNEPEVVKILAAGRIDVNVLSEDGETALHIATRRGHVRIIELLLKAGARVNGPDRFGFTPLHYAIQCDLVQARTLIDTFFPAAWPSSSAAFSTLWVATSNEALMTMLLEGGARPYAAGRDGTTCFHFALRLRKIAESVMLMKHADVAAHIGMDAPTAIGETPLHLLAALGVVNLLDAALKAHFFIVTRSKAEAASVSRDYQALAKARSLRPVEDVYHAALQGGSIGTKLSAPKWNGAVPCLHPETIEEAVALSRACYVTRMLHSTGSTVLSQAMDAPVPTGQLGIAFPMAVALRETPSLAAMVGSDRFRNQGLVPAVAQEGGVGDADVLLWTPAGVIDTERGYVSEVPRIIRGVVLHELGLAIVQARERAAGDSTNNLLNSHVPSGSTGTGQPTITKALLTFDLFVDMLDSLDQPHVHQQQQQQPPDDMHTNAERIGKESTEPEQRATRSIVDMAAEMGSVASSTAAASAAPSMSTASEARGRRVGSLSLRSKMALVLGDAAPTWTSQSLGIYDAMAAHTHETCCVVAEDLLALLPISAPQEVVCPLDVAIRSGPMFGRTPLSFCNGNGASVTPLNEKRCVMMLLALRTQLLAEDTFGMLCGDL